MFEARRQEELKQLREEQRLHEVAKAGLGEAVEGKQSLVVGLAVVVVIVVVASSEALVSNLSHVPYPSHCHLCCWAPCISGLC